ncbi:hypothetical protein Tco_1206927 [Tanacetum coccineum]
MLSRRFDLLVTRFEQARQFDRSIKQFEQCSVSHADAHVDSFKRCYTSYTFDVGYMVLRAFLLHRSSFNNSASLSNKFRGLYFSFKFGISGLLHHVVTTISRQNTRLVSLPESLKVVLLDDNVTSQSKQNFQSSSTMFTTVQDLCLRQELLEYISVHNNDASKSSKPSWGKTCTLILSGQLPGGVLYTTLPSMVCVKYSTYMRRIVADFLHVPPNGSSSRRNDMKQYRSNSI